MDKTKLAELFTSAGLTPTLAEAHGANYVITSRIDGGMIRAQGSDMPGRGVAIIVRTGTPYAGFLAASAKIEPADPEAIAMLLDLYASREWADWK